MIEPCDVCGEVREVKLSNPLRAFCSAVCANRYLKGEGFDFQICINCERQKTYGGQQVCDECLNGGGSDHVVMEEAEKEKTND